MFGPVTRLRKFKSLSPLSSPHTSPVASPKSSKRKFGIYSPKFGKKDDPDSTLTALTSRLSTHKKDQFQMVRESEIEETDFKRIQNLFPFDNLLLSHKNPVPKGKGTTAKLHRALSGKSKVSPAERDGKLPKNKDVFNLVRDDCRLHRQFVMEGPTQFTVGVQNQERILFLFTDLLLIAKVRTSGVYKLKETVRISEIWLSECVEDVSEVTHSREMSFVLGWPTTNVVATFGSVQLRNLWHAKLKQLSTETKSRGPKTATIAVLYSLGNSKEEQCKYLSVSSHETARECIESVLLQLGIRKDDSSSYQLWVKTAGDDSPYPLFGHECPFAIKMNSVRRAPRASDKPRSQQKDRRNYCTFILRNTKKSQVKSGGMIPVSRKSKISRKALLMHKVFRRSASKPDSLDLSNGHSGPCGKLFGHHLTKLYEDKTSLLPMLEILAQLMQKGPFTHGIFRKSANTKACRELREKLDAQCECKVDKLNILILAAVFKEFLRSLPTCLLLCELYDDWLIVARLKSVSEKVTKTSKLLGKLPKANSMLLQHFLCVLWHIAQRSSENQMSPSNLAVCVGPSLLWSNNPNIRPEASKQIPPLIEFLIEKVTVFFGKDVLHLFGGPSTKDISRQDSGAEESDSMHSSVGLRRDDSSIDSLEHALLGDGESSPKLPCRSKMSLTNLSRDSGLTMSDSQLYTPDEEEERQAVCSAGNSGRENRVVENRSAFPRNESSPVYNDVKNSKLPVYERTVSVCELPSSRDVQMLIRSKSTHLPCADYELDNDDMFFKEETNGLPSMEDFQTVIDCGDNSAKNLLCCRKETHKRRLSRPRRWYNPRTPWDPDDISPVTTLRKSASEESLLNNFTLRRPANHIERSPRPCGKYSVGAASKAYEGRHVGESQSPGIYRSTSVHHLLLPESASRPSDDMYGYSPAVDVKWHRTQSTPHLDDGSYDSSTLSDDDSTPHVSRSNSRGKDYMSDGTLTSQEMCRSMGSLHCPVPVNSPPCSDPHPGKVYASPSKVVVHPPSYEETLNRQTFLRQNTTGLCDEPLYINLGSHGKRVSDKSVRLCSKQMQALEGELHYATPIRIESGDDSEPPPLPPKPKPVHSSDGVRSSASGLLPSSPIKIGANESTNIHISPRHSSSVPSTPIRISPMLPQVSRSPINRESLFSDKKSHHPLQRSPHMQFNANTGNFILRNTTGIIDFSSDSSSTTSSSSSGSRRGNVSASSRPPCVAFKQRIAVGPSRTYQQPTKGFLFHKPLAVGAVTNARSKTKWDETSSAKGSYVVEESYV